MNSTPPRFGKSTFSFAAVCALVALLLAPPTYPAGASAAPTAAPAELKPYTAKIPGTGVTFDMVPIPGGKFRMGSPAGEKGRKEDEGPQVEVEVKSFYMGRCEVTQAEYAEFSSGYPRLAGAKPRPVPGNRLADAVTYPTPMYELEVGPILERMGRGGSYPAVHMSQFAAKQYTKWLSKKTGRFYRLPTEAEWEYACRAGTDSAYSFGGDGAGKLDAFAWYFDNASLSDGDVAYRRVGLKKPNAWGLYDMHGNVAEWVIDAYAADRYGRSRRAEPRPAGEVVNWPTQLYPRVIRGGSYQSEPQECRSAARHRAGKEINKYDACLPQSAHWDSAAMWVGFRVVCPVDEPAESEKHRYWNADNEVTRNTIKSDRQIHELITPPP